MKKLVMWFLWHMAYLSRDPWKGLYSREPFDEYLLRKQRLRWPWRKFRPAVWHCGVGNTWHIYLDDEESCTVPRKVMMTVNVHIGRETGTVTGFNLYDEDLRALAESATSP